MCLPFWIRLYNKRTFLSLSIVLKRFVPSNGLMVVTVFTAGCGNWLLEVMARLPSNTAKICWSPFREEQPLSGFIEGCYEQVLDTIQNLILAPWRQSMYKQDYHCPVLFGHVWEYFMMLKEISLTILSCMRVFYDAERNQSHHFVTDFSPYQNCLQLVSDQMAAPVSEIIQHNYNTFSVSCW
jgi:hypothetical protein